MKCIRISVLLALLACAVIGQAYPVGRLLPFEPAKETPGS